MKKLKPSAIPSLFPNLPSHYSKSLPDPREENGSQTRHDKVYHRQEELSSSFLELDKIHSLQDIRDKLDRTCLAPGYTELYQDSNLYFLFISTDPTDLRPYVKLSLTITEELNFSAFGGSLKISKYLSTRSDMQKKRNVLYYQDPTRGYQSSVGVPALLYRDPSSGYQSSVVSARTRAYRNPCLGFRSPV